jgi:hypothetical protein
LALQYSSDRFLSFFSKSIDDPSAANYNNKNIQITTTPLLSSPSKMKFIVITAASLLASSAVAFVPTSSLNLRGK